MLTLPTQLSPQTLPTLLRLLREAVSSRRPERDLVKLLARLTGGFAEVRASWGDVVAASGSETHAAQDFRLTHAGRNVGTLRLDLPSQWADLAPIAAEYALLARLQSAAAGAARRRVGERTLDALLDGRESESVLGEEAFAVAAASFAGRPGRGAGARAAQAHALDVLAGAGEGFFNERGLSGLCTVRGDLALWLWPAQDVQAEAAGLFAALRESTGQAVRLGLSTRQHSTQQSVAAAFAEAGHALSEVSSEGFAVFTRPDALHSLLQSPALDELRRQVRSELAALGDGGRTEATLIAFLTHSGTLEELAAQQRIHVNTLRYRLQAAERAVKGPMNSPATLCRVYLALMPS